MEENKKERKYILEGFVNFSKVFKTLKRSFFFAFKSDKVTLISMFILAAFSAMLPYLQNGLLSHLINQTIEIKKVGSSLAPLVKTIIWIIIATSIPSIISIFRSFVQTSFRFKILRDLELHFMKKIASLDIATIEGTDFQELKQKANERGTGSIQVFLSFVVDNFSNLIGVLVSASILFFVDKTLLVYALLGVLPGLFIEMKYGKDVYWIWDLNSNNRRKYFNRRGHFNDTISLIELKLNQLSNKFVGEIENILTLFDEELEGNEKSKVLFDFLSNFVYILFLGISIWRIAHLTILGLLPVGSMLFAYTTYRGFNGTLSEFFRKFGTITEYSNYSAYWFELEDLQPKITENQNALVLSKDEKPPRIEFKNVWFKYSDTSETYAIEDLNLVIDPGEKVAIVGLSGAGKTTLIKLLCRVYDPEKGEILINGTNLKDISLKSWHEHLGVLFQDYTSYQFTAKEAIAISKSGEPIDEDKVVRAAQAAKAHDFIERLPKKYDQLLWKGFEDGVDLSKGERQRMALARVFYRESLITILDEPTASVDALAEQEIFQTLEKLPEDRTVVLISHRFSTVKNAHKIFVIEHGKLIEEGDHNKLMELNGKYAELYTLQKESYT